MDFWVTIATVLPILGLPLVLLARVHVAQTLDLPLLARLTAGMYALILVAIYLMEVVAVGQLANSADVPGSEWLQDAAFVVVVFAGSALILSPGYLLLRITFAGPGLGFKFAFDAWSLRVRVWLTARKTWSLRLALWRNIHKLHRSVGEFGETWFKDWDEAIADGLLIYGPMSADTEARARFAELEEFHETLVSKWATTEIDVWQANYSFDQLRKTGKSNQERLQMIVRMTHESNLRAVWKVFDDMTAPQHGREGRASDFVHTKRARAALGSARS
ncbi:hypothetical protein [Promicromonospora sp. NFX87]|uniref:hypothetical protein n=1 Tax=Promicromonospora sp. NFX87 TaxID=3402691 RepID=UPI003AFA4431